MSQRLTGRARRHRRIRKRMAGFPDRPRLNLFRSHKHLYAQVINDLENVTLFGRSTKASKKPGGTVPAAQQLGRIVAEEAMRRGIRRVVFDRGGYRYHGRVKAFADTAREGGLEF